MATVSEKTRIPDTIDVRVLSRILDEGYGPGAWHGNDMRAAVADVAVQDAFRRPQPERHNIAEIALHHTYFVPKVRADLSGQPPEPFVLQGEEWLDLPNESVLAWRDIRSLLDTEQRRLAEFVGTLRTPPRTNNSNTFDLVLGITCHAVYSAAQIQLLKKLLGK
jgi:hypothetical protein